MSKWQPIETAPKDGTVMVDDDMKWRKIETSA
jgi:hypothetical protein